MYANWFVVILHCTYKIQYCCKMDNFSFSSINAQFQQAMRADGLHLMHAHNTHTHTSTHMDVHRHNTAIERYSESLLALPHACPLRCNGAPRTTYNTFCREAAAVCNTLQSLIPRASLHTSTSCMYGAFVYALACTSRCICGPVNVCIAGVRGGFERVLYRIMGQRMWRLSSVCACVCLCMWDHAHDTRLDQVTLFC